MRRVSWRDSAELMEEIRMSACKIGFTFCSETFFSKLRFPRDSKLSTTGVFMIYERQALQNDSVGFITAAGLIFG